MANQAEVAAELAAVTATVGKIAGETSSLLTKIEELLAIIANGAVTPELEAAVAALKVQVAVVDDLVADLPPPVEA